MAKNKGPRTFITIECINCKTNKNKKGVSRYLTFKNKRNTPEKLEIKKYCKFCNQHTIHKEIK